MAQPEQQAREEIDRLLQAAGWRVCDLAEAKAETNLFSWLFLQETSLIVGCREAQIYQRKSGE